MSTPTALLPDWLDAPTACYASLLKSHRLSDQTCRVYLSMFSKFAAFLCQEKTRLDQCTAANIQHFFILHDIHKRHRFRYIRMLENIYDHLIDLNPAAGLHNPASQAAKKKLGRGENDPMNFLAMADIDKVTAYFTKPVAVKERGKKIKKIEWKENRDRALTAIMLFGAVKVSEARAMTVNCVSEGGKELLVKAIVELKKISSTNETEEGAGAAEKRKDPHIAKLLPPGIAPLLSWIALRALVITAGDTLFPASPDGEAMHAASIYRAVMKILDQAGVDLDTKARISPQTLRNTYAGMMLDLGAPHHEIKSAMGIYDTLTIQRIKDAYQLWQNQQLHIVEE